MAPKPPGHGDNAARSIALKEFAGVNTQADRTSIKETQFSWLENLIPLGHGNLRCVPAASAELASTATNILNWQYVNINNVDLALVFLVDGSGYSFNLSNALTQFAPPGTFTGTPQASQWKDERALIIANNGYWSWDGTTFAAINGLVSGFTVTIAGSGYTSVPTVALTGGGGSGATATAVIGLTYAVLPAAGTGYSVGDVLNLVGGTNTVVAQCQITTISGTGAITGFQILAAGNYTAVPSNPVATTGGTGTGATVTATWGVASITLGAAGTGYTTPPTVAITGGGGSGATATATVTTAPASGTGIASYQGHVWIISGRTLTYSSPGAYNDFSTTTGGGTTILTDESLHSALTGIIANNGYLYIFAGNGVNIISNVTVPSSGTTAGLTTFSNVNITSAVGTNYTGSITAYQRAIVFADSYGFHGIFGATVKKLSDDIDGTFPYIDITKPITSGLAVVYNNIVPAFLFQYLDPTNNGTARPLLAVNHNGKWWFSSQASNLVAIYSAYIGDSPTLFGTDGRAIYRLFADQTGAISSSFSTALLSMEVPWTVKQSLKLGLELTSLTNLLAGDAVCETETGSSDTISQSAGFQFINNAGSTVRFFNNSGQEVDFIKLGRQVFQGNVEVYGKYLGSSWTSDTPNYSLNGVLLQFKDRAEWGSLPGAGF